MHQLAILKTGMTVLNVLSKGLSGPTGEITVGLLKKVIRANKPAPVETEVHFHRCTIQH